MANYTLELRQIVESCNYNLFDFDYNLYDNDHKEEFEQKFIDYFYFDEIGFKTVEIFKHRLRTKLNIIYPYYRQLYETELRCLDVDFMLNKDLKETYIRESKNLHESNLNSNNVSNDKSNSEGLGINSDTPQSSVDDIEKYMSSATKNKMNNTSVSNDELNSNSTNNSQSSEKTELLSQGNIGVTSSAELLSKWRGILLNIDLMIFEELRELFMLIY